MAECEQFARPSPGDVDPQGIADPSPWSGPAADESASDNQDRQPQADPDVNLDGIVAPGDALEIINYLSEFGSHQIDTGQLAQENLDVNDDQWISAVDVLGVINALPATNIDALAEGGGGSLAAIAVDHAQPQSDLFERNQITQKSAFQNLFP